MRIPIQVVDKGNGALSVVDHMEADAKLMRLDRLLDEKHVGLVIFHEDYRRGFGCRLRVIREW